MKRTIFEGVLILGGVMIILFTISTPITVQFNLELHPDENLDDVHTRISAIGVNSTDQFDFWTDNSTIQTIFKIILRYQDWNDGRQSASFSAYCRHPRELAIPVEYSLTTTNTIALEDWRSKYLPCAEGYTSFLIHSRVTNRTAVMYFNVTDWTYDTLPIGNYSFQVGGPAWQERLSATLHVESEHTWTEIEDLPEGWGMPTPFSAYIPWIVGAVMVVLWGWDRIRAVSTIDIHFYPMTEEGVPHEEEIPYTDVDKSTFH